MKLIHVPRSLLAAAGSLFVLVPVSVLTAGVFSKRAWWNLPIAHLQVVGWATLVWIVPLSWRFLMGRRGAWEALVSICGLGCILLLSKAAINRDTFQALWSLGVTSVCVFLIFWTKREQSKSYFDPQLSWFQGLPRPIPQLQAKLVGLDETALPSPLAVCRLDEEGLFAFSQQGQIVPHVDVELELFHGNLLDERKIRLKGRVVRQFESRVCQGRSRDWGIGVQWSPMTPDSKKDFQDFLEVLRGEGYV